MAIKPNTMNGKTADGDKTTANDRKRLAAHKHLDRLIAKAHKRLDESFDDAEGPQVDGRRFWGHIDLTIQFNDGQAFGDIVANLHIRDRLQAPRT